MSATVSINLNEMRRLADGKVKLESVSILGGRYLSMKHLDKLVIHAAVAEDSPPLVLGRLKRQPGEALCKRTWVTNDNSVPCETPVSCPQCLALVAKVKEAGLSD